ncbi:MULTISPECIES: copper-binding protein [Dickeya]|uniref:Cobalt transporter n=1 Tax=Dickeya fangzhongdai TaxID=1778540 RepID=A0A2K8QLY8_9GAMM|nr:MULTISPECIES: copper-binding protein [Dickeya]ATZ93750.1 cobalt transporter [Dickeya fangzhongdai]QOH47183.1 cobalt transporter [Dickeya fangzhongdai]QOH51489.1 cobalt transporter [Dickeya fangzhongdai]ULR32434.1 copper-binding protein [Dickeya fangzhongdai]UMB78110.1 copper-binding protein [Dickeya fangzhongdai]
MRMLSVAIATLLFSAPLLAEQNQTHTMTGEMGNMSHTMPGGMNHDMSSMTADAAPVYRTTGTVKQWNASGVTLAHAAVPALRWPAMTMNFRLPANNHWTPLPQGSAVSFSFVQSADGYTLTDIKPQQN